VSTAPVGSLYIDGRWSEGGAGALDVFDSRDGSVLAAVESADDADVEAAVTAAVAAQRGWARTPSIARGSHLRMIADVVSANAASLAEILVKEVGKPIAEARGEVAFAESMLRYHAEWDRRLEGEVLPGEVAGEQIQLLREPIGVVAAICPWNFPIAVLCRKLAPALVTGNTVVVKPSEVTPLSAIELFRLIDERLELPPGVIGLVCGDGSTGSALVRHPQVGIISFTGHRDTGKRIMSAASANLTRVSLELGGKAPAIVCADADLSVTIPAIITARHTNAGQVCTSAERVFVESAIADEFTERYVAAAQSLVIGDPSGEVDMGPLVSQAQLEKTVAAVAGARDEGAAVLLGGDRPSGDEFASGYWHGPTVLSDLRPDMAIMREETFGPVTPIMTVDSVLEAVSLANDSRYGLSAYVFSRDYATVMRTVDALAFGEIYINRTHGESVHAHHAGYKESGMGGEDGKWGLLRYTQIKTAYHRYG
jgi:lactaldehyde dehydrogenase / glycolaldehyde dehydrogenase